MQLRPIEIDIDVYRHVEGKRSSFAQSHNEILREIFGLNPEKASSSPIFNGGDDSPAWSWKGLILPHGAKLRMNYNGRAHTGEVSNGAWHIEGAIYRTPSAAAKGVARTKKGQPVSLDGWRYWEAQLPGTTRWRRLDDLRRKPNR